MNRLSTQLVLLLLGCAQATFALDSDEGVHSDLVGDAEIRRTDADNNAPLPPGFEPIDLIEVRVQGWETNTPMSNPYAGGTSGGDAELVRIQIVLDGLVAPPGPLGFNGSQYAPYRFGARPIFGYIELDVDDCHDTGGELMPLARNRYLANVGRFSLSPQDSIAQRIVREPGDLDSNFSSQPQFERSGAEFALTLCGCHTTSIVSQDGNLDSIFDPGETWLVRGRFFERFSSFQNASGLFGGSDFGLFDPIVNLQFKHIISTNQTSVTLIFPVTNEGAAELLGEAEEMHDSRLDNQTSMAEALLDLIDSVDFATGSLFQLVAGWEYQNLEDYLRPGDWGVRAIIGTAPLQQDPAALFVWTDTGFDEIRGDIDGDDLFTLQDNDVIMTTIYELDGGPQDADGIINNQVQISNFATEFNIQDLNYDGLLSELDLAQIPEYTVVPISNYSTPTTIRGVSEAGHVVGDQEVFGVARPFISRQGVGLSLLPLPMGYISGAAFDVNSNGVVVGTVSKTTNPLSDGEPAIWTQGGNGTYWVTIPQQFAAMQGPLGPTTIDGGQATVINEQGTIVGWSRFSGQSSGPATRFFLAAAPIDLKALGFDATVADINDLDVIVGGGLRFDLATSTVMDLGIPPDGFDQVDFISVHAQSLNNENQIIAAARRDTSGSNPFLTYVHDDLNGWQPHNINQSPTADIGFYDNNDSGDVSATGGARFAPDGILADGYDDLLATDQMHWETSIGYINNDRQVYTTAYNSMTGQDFIVVLVPDDLPQICVADLNQDGVLDFFDVSTFLLAYNTMQPIADLNGDGLYDFFDVSAFLTGYLVGCP